MTLIPIRDVHRVAVLGSGTIGASWAAWFLGRGLDVTAQDPSPGQEDFCRGFVETVWLQLERIGLGPKASPTRLRFVTDPAQAVSDADFVQENAPERESLKRDLLHVVDEALPEDRVIASSTSGYPPAVLQQGLRHPERLVIGHPFNPPHLIPLVEVVAGEASPPEAALWACEFYRSIGKHPIHIRKAVPGHVANRLQAALWREVVHLVREGVASVADIDEAVTHSIGLRWSLVGPTLTFALGGGPGGIDHFLEHLGPWIESLWDDLGRPKLTPELCRQIAAGVAQELGNQSMQQLVKERDDGLLDLLELRKRQGA